MNTEVRRDKRFYVTHSYSAQTATMAIKSHVGIIIGKKFSMLCDDTCFGGVGRDDVGQPGT
jgi:hypothetical protein